MVSSSRSVKRTEYVYASDTPCSESDATLATAGDPQITVLPIIHIKTPTNSVVALGLCANAA